MGAGLEGITVEQAYALKGDAKKKLRGVAKGPNFGLPGGMGAARLMDYCRLSYGVELTLERAQQACQVWRKTYREAQPYLDWVSYLVGQKRGSKATIEQFVSKRLRGKVGFCDAANGFFQGLAADIAKDAGWRLVEQAYEVKSSPLYGCRPVVFVHDEWLYEVPLDRLTEAGELAASIMTKTAMEWCPDVLFTASPAASLRWSKAAGDPVRDKAGNLIPFEWRDRA
jgi:DNA polymerase I-like protein with 3'-5' exonuclease and polymerase domains